MQPSDLRRHLNDTIFRGRRKVDVDSAVVIERRAKVAEHHRGETVALSETDVSGDSIYGLYPDIKWARVSVSVHDESDPSQVTLNLLLAKKRNEICNAGLQAVCVLHATSASCDSAAMLSVKARFARAGFLAVGLNSRYHGCRSGAGHEGKDGYLKALVQAWKRNSEDTAKNLYPFIYDTAADLRYVADYLVTRPDVDGNKLGITGISLGGMHAWFAAAADERWTVVAPLIGVQSFNYAVDEDCYHERVSSIQEVFDAAAQDLKAEGVTCEVVRAVWNRICPGLLEHFDAGHSLALLSPRRVFIANGELDARCPVRGVEKAVQVAREAYEKSGVDSARLELHVYEGVGHSVTDEMWSDCIAFFKRSFADMELEPSAGSASAVHEFQTQHTEQEVDVPSRV